LRRHATHAHLDAWRKGKQLRDKSETYLQVDIFCSTVVYYKYTQIYTYEHFITNME